MLNPSFNKEHWANAPVEDFIEETARWKWSEQDAVLHHAKMRKDLGLDEAKKKPVKTPTPKADDTKRGGDTKAAGQGAGATSETV